MMLLIYFGLFNLFIMLLVFYFMRSSKEMPKTWAQLKSEIKLQVYGTRALAEDIILRRKNKVELFKQPGKIALLTGGNRGIGFRIVKKLLECEMTLILGVRNPAEAQKAVEKYLNHNKIKGTIHYEQLDIGNMKSVCQFSERVKSKFDKIHILFNNAGVMSVPFRLTSEGFESHMAINYLGHFLLTHLMLPLLRNAGTETCNARIVNVSSCVHKLGGINYDDINGLKDYYPADAYNQSKLAQVLFSKYINDKLQERGDHIQSHSLHPGVVNTDLFENSSTTYIPWFRQLLFKTPEEGSRTVVFAAISPKLEGKGGTYLSNCRFAKSHPHHKNPTECEKFFKFTCNMMEIQDFFGK